MSIKSRFILKLRKNDEINNTPSNNNIFGRFLKDGANILAISITQVHNLSIKQPSHFPTSCKVAFKKVSKTDPKNFSADFPFTHNFKNFKENYTRSNYGKLLMVHQKHARNSNGRF